MSFQRVLSYLTPLSVAAAIALPAAPAHAFKIKTHVVISNEVLKSMTAVKHGHTVPIRGFGDVRIENLLAEGAVLTYPEYFRAGTLGPDMFPDMIAGQYWVHTNQGGELCPYTTHSADDPCVDSSVNLEARVATDRWRAVDYGMYMLNRALAYRLDEVTAESEEARRQAIAFAYGYLSHFAGDGFAHTYINEWTRAVFLLFQGRPGTFYGPITEELEHIAVETYIDKHIPATADELKIAWPRQFLHDLFTNDIQGDLVLPGGPGSFGGPYFEWIVWFRDLMTRLSHSENWAQMVLDDSDPSAAALLKALNEINKVRHTIDIATYGLGDPIVDLESYFAQRARIADALLLKWVDLSGCIAQNLLNGAITPADGPFPLDACNGYTEEPEVFDLFQDKLKDAVRSFDDQAKNYGKLKNNFGKMDAFIRAVAERMFVFKLDRDVRTIAVIKDAIDPCQPNGIIHNSTCKAYCDKVEDICRDAAQEGCRDSCPPVFLDPFHHFLCEEACDNVTVPLTCGAAAATASAGACAFCTANPVCQVIDNIDALWDSSRYFVENWVEKKMKKIEKDVGLALLDNYLGPYAAAFVDVLDEWDTTFDNSKPAWYVNMAFLQEDMAADPNYIDRMLQAALGITISVASNLPDLAEATAATTAKTLEDGKKIVGLVVQAESGELQAKIWQGVVETLYRMVREGDLNLVHQIDNNAAYQWLDGLRFRESNATYSTRFGKLVALFAKLNLLTKFRGTTVTALHHELHLPTGEDADTAPLDLYKFHPTANAIELVKMVLMKDSGVTSRFTEGHPLANLQRSAICAVTPNILCDSVQSADNPNNYVTSDERSNAYSDMLHKDGPDWERSVAAWVTRDRVWGPDGVTQRACQLRATDFPLAETQDMIDNVYQKIFLLPENCSGEPINIAAGKPATQSSDLGPPTVAALAVDGKTDGHYNVGSLAITSHDPSPWWQVDLGAVHDVGKIVLWNRTDCCSDRLGGAYVFVSQKELLPSSSWADLFFDPEVAHFRVDPSFSGESFTLNANVAGRYVRVQHDDLAPRYLQLAEVQVFETQALVAQPRVTMSSFLPGSEPQRAFDGNIDGDLGHGSVARSDRELSPWWQVDLGKTQSIGTITLWNRTDCCADRMHDLTIYVSESAFQVDADGRPLPSSDVDAFAISGQTRPDHQTFQRLDTTVNRKGRFVRVQLEAGAPEYLQLAEVQITPERDAGAFPVAHQSSDLGPGWEAGKSIDQNIDGTPGGGSMSSTGGQLYPYWEVDYGATVSMNEIHLWNRQDCCSGRLSNVKVFVSDHPFRHDMPLSTNDEVGVQTYFVPGHDLSDGGTQRETVIQAGTRGRYLRVQLTAGTEEYLTLAEVQVF